MRQKAKLEIGRNARAVATTVANRQTISSSAIPGRRNLKNSPDHATFSANWAKNRVRASLVPLHPALRQTSQALSAIKKYRVDQTGAKIQFGGLKDGFLSSAYQVPTEEDVQIEPSTAALQHKSTKKRSMNQPLSDMAGRRLSHLLDVLMGIKLL